MARPAAPPPRDGSTSPPAPPAAGDAARSASAMAWTASRARSRQAPSSSGCRRPGDASGLRRSEVSRRVDNMSSSRSGLNSGLLLSLKYYFQAFRGSHDGCAQGGTQRAHARHDRLELGPGRQLNARVAQADRDQAQAAQTCGVRLDQEHEGPIVAVVGVNGEIVQEVPGVVE